MATKQEIIARAKEIIVSQPSAGKSKVNSLLKYEFGVGLRSSTILTLKAEVSKEQPKLAPELYRTGGVKKGFRAIYNTWVSKGFTYYEARELTLGQGHLTVGGSRNVLTSEPGQAAIRTRQQWIQARLKDGWTKKQIKGQILADYQRRLGTQDKFGKPFSPWTHIRLEYVPKPKVSKQEYKDMIERRKTKKAKRQAKRRQKPGSSYYTGG